MYCFRLIDSPLCTQSYTTSTEYRRPVNGENERMRYDCGRMPTQDACSVIFNRTNSSILNAGVRKIWHVLQSTSSSFLVGAHEGRICHRPPWWILQNLSCILVRVSTIYSTCLTYDDPRITIERNTKEPTKENIEQMRTNVHFVPYRCSLLFLYMVLSAPIVTLLGRARGGSYYCTAFAASATPRRITETTDTTTKGYRSFVPRVSGGIRSRTESSSAVVRLYDSKSPGSISNSGDGEKINGEGYKPQPQQQQRQQQSQRQRTPQTGWNHNQPSSESNFWKGSIDEKAATSSAGKTSSASKEARTGWLHNNRRSNNNNQNNNKSATSSSIGATSMKGPTESTARRRLEWAKLQLQRNHRIVAPPTFHPCGDDRLVVSTEHYISVPIFRNDESKDEQMDVYFCIVETIPSEATRQFFRSELANMALTPSQRATKYVEYSNLQNADDMVLYLQGGPGFGAPTPSVGLGFGKGCGSCMTWDIVASF